MMKKRQFELEGILRKHIPGPDLGSDVSGRGQIQVWQTRYPGGVITWEVLRDGWYNRDTLLPVSPGAIRVQTRIIRYAPFRCAFQIQTENALAEATPDLIAGILLGLVFSAGHQLPEGERLGEN